MHFGRATLSHGIILTMKMMRMVVVALAPCCASLFTVFTNLITINFVLS